MIAQICLTPWESRRLIANGVTQLESVKKALTDGIISIARGTTNGYVVEEILVDSTILLLFELRQDFEPASNGKSKHQLDRVG